MPKYWRANFGTDACLQHGIKRNLWMMEYQYESDDSGAIRKNWQRVGGISPGDWFVAYLKPNTFYAIGKVIAHRRPKTDDDVTDTIANYLTRQRSHDHHSGYVYYTPVFYEDFADRWRHPDSKLSRWPQRVDVEEWKDYVPDGISVDGLSIVPTYENHLAVTKITRRDFDRIAKKLATERGLLPSPSVPPDGSAAAGEEPG